VATTSTKSRARKRQGAQGKQTTSAQQASAPALEHTYAASELSTRTWQLAGFLVVSVATLMRVCKLEMNPLHHDEGVNGFFLLNLMRHHIYQYDPANYHGPTLYYFALPLTYPLDHFHQLDTWALRAVTVAFGVALVWLTLHLRRYIGAVGALSAAALLAVSPGMVYNSRYFIHEMLFVFFTLGIVVAALRFYEGAAQPQTFARPYLNSGGMGLLSASTGILLLVTTLFAVYSTSQFRFDLWLTLALAALAVTIGALWAYDGPRANYLLLATASAALLFATKETAFISATVLVLASLIAWIFFNVRRQMRRASASSKRRRKQAQGHESAWAAFIARSGGWQHLALLVVIALCLFVFINLVYYSSFFTNPKGVYDGFIETFKKWTETGTSDFHRHPFNTYLSWLGQEEAPLFLLAVWGTTVAVLRGRSRFAIFAGAWAFGILLAYSLVPYKTPWLQLNIVLPLAIVGGYAIDFLYRRAHDANMRALALAPLAVALAIALYQTYQLNFVNYDDDTYVYVYAHTQRGYLQLIDQINKFAARAGTGYETNINVASPDYWPMPWYLRDYRHVGYPGRISPTTDPIVIINANQAGEALGTLGDEYREVGTYPLRPGVTLELFVRRELTD
jgi:uncharacterized protein (TIGR03663 family)